MRRDLSERISYWLFQDKIPVVKSVIVANIVTFFAIYLFNLVSLSYGIFFSELISRRPWTVLTYPLIGVYGTGAMAVLSLLFSCYWLWIAGGCLERAVGSTRFALYFFTMCAISALGLWLGGRIVRVDTYAVGLWLPIAGVTVAFAMRNPEEQILFNFFLPMKLKYLALIDAIMVLVSYSSIHIIVGVCALAGCVYSYWYATVASRRGYSPREERGQVVNVFGRKSFFSRLNPFKKVRDHRDRDRLRKLFEDSGMKDDEERR